jgi:broad specificity phosphatase PhoE
VKVFLFRHGEIECGGKARLLGRTDVPLSETGRSQALWWRSALERVTFGQVYCSDLVRARETAEILAANATAPITVLPQLREIDLGHWDGMTREEVNARFPGEWDKRGLCISEYRPVAGESFADLAGRVVPVLEVVTNGPEDIVAIVGHAGVNRVILCHVLGMRLQHLFRLRQDYGALNIIEGTHDFRQVSMMNLAPNSNPIPGLLFPRP